MQQFWVKHDSNAPVQSEGNNWTGITLSSLDSTCKDQKIHISEF